MAPPVVGRTIFLSAFAIDSDGVYKSVTSASNWISSNPAVVRVSSSGVISAIGLGSATVAAVYQGFTDSVDVPVRASTPAVPYLVVFGPVSAVQVGYASGARAYVQQTTSLQQDVTEVATWTSSNPGVAVVERGRIMPMAPGNTEISAAYNGLSN